VCYIRRMDITWVGADGGVVDDACVMICVIWGVYKWVSVGGGELGRCTD
jgi:hypothetical protein